MPLSRGGDRKRASGYADAGMRAWIKKIELEKTRKASQNGTRTLTSGCSRNERTMTAMSSVLKIAEVFPPEEEKSEFQLKTEENCKLQTAQGMLHCYMEPSGRSWLEKVPVAEETTKKTALRMLLLRDRRLALSPAR